MIDESTDIPRPQRVSLVIHYTDDLFNVYERFIGFDRATDTSAEGLFHLVMEWLNKEHCRSMFRWSKLYARTM